MASNINPGGSFDDSLSFSNGNVGDSLQSEIELLLRARHNQATTDQGKYLNIYRSGSAPPTVQGSLRAVGSLFRNSEFLHNDGSNVNGILSEDDILSHPAYLSYYYSHENINPRLPPPLLSKEDWRVAQRFQAGAASSRGLGNWRNNRLVGDTSESSSLFSMQPGPSVRSAENDLLELRKTAGRELPSKASAEWLERTSDVVSGFSDIIQAMMKDAFGNYVVQKVLETCDDQSLELILYRIKIHLNSLKKYTYGKHIVARIEKLIASGERRIDLLSSLTA